MTTPTERFCKECGKELDAIIDPRSAGRDGWRLNFCSHGCEFRYDGAQSIKAGQTAIAVLVLSIFLPLLLVAISAGLEKLK